MTNITWTDDKRKLSQLIPWKRNPRQIKGANVKRLQESFEEFGQPEPVIIGPNNELYNGHQRLKSWLSRFGDVEVAVRVASRALTEKEREKLTVYLHKGATGEFDYDILANEFEIDELLEWGFDAWELGGVPDDGDWADGFGGLPTEDRAPFQQMTFTLHDTQAEQVKAAIAAAVKIGDFADSPNQNSNGNALAFISETFITEYGQS